MFELEGLKALVASDGPVEIRVEAVLTLHQRMTTRSCLCGFDELGRAFARHQTEELRKAGLLKS